MPACRRTVLLCLLPFPFACLSSPTLGSSHSSLYHPPRQRVSRRSPLQPFPTVAVGAQVAVTHPITDISFRQAPLPPTFPNHDCKSDIHQTGPGGKSEQWEKRWRGSRSGQRREEGRPAIGTMCLGPCVPLCSASSTPPIISLSSYQHAALLPAPGRQPRGSRPAGPWGGTWRSAGPLCRPLSEGRGCGSRIQAGTGRPRCRGGGAVAERRWRWGQRWSLSFCGRLILARLA